jgi:hypothetical protein
VQARAEYLCPLMLQTFDQSQRALYLRYFTFTDYAERLFDLVDNFAESSKRKAAVWPLQTMLLILCPVS